MFLICRMPFFTTFATAYFNNKPKETTNDEKSYIVLFDDDHEFLFDGATEDGQAGTWYGHCTNRKHKRQAIKYDWLATIGQ